MFRTLFDRDTWQEIFGSIQKNKLRTVVTVIGVLWGIFIYIALSGASKGLDNGFEREFEDTAINSLFVWAQRTSIPYQGFRTGRSLQLKLNDEPYLADRIPQLQYIAPRIARGVFGNDGAFMAISPFWLKLRLKTFLKVGDLLIRRILTKNEKYV
jgi:putative ABC transport system permease protein